MATTIEREHLEDEMVSILAARKDVSGDEERHLVEKFLEQVDREVDSRIEARLNTTPPAPRSSIDWPTAAAIIVALVIALPIVGAAGFYAGTFGVVSALAALLFLVVVLVRSSNWLY